MSDHILVPGTDQGLFLYSISSVSVLLKQPLFILKQTFLFQFKFDHSPSPPAWLYFLESWSWKCSLVKDSLSAWYEFIMPWTAHNINVKQRHKTTKITCCFTQSLQFIRFTDSIHYIWALALKQLCFVHMTYLIKADVLRSQHQTWTKHPTDTLLEMESKLFVSWAAEGV